VFVTIAAPFGEAYDWGGIHSVKLIISESTEGQNKAGRSTLLACEKHAHKKPVRHNRSPAYFLDTNTSPSRGRPYFVMLARRGNAIFAHEEAASCSINVDRQNR